MSCDEDFLNHDLEDINDHDTTSTEEVDMDISSTTTCGRIETNIPVMPAANRELLMEGVDQSVRSLPPGYEKTFVCNISKLEELFNFCMDKGCNMPITEVFEKFVGCALEIRWRCKAGHCGDWVSSKMVNRVYVNNIHTAASILFTGNSFCKISLFAKSLQLPFISSSTFLNYQRKYLAPQVHHLWKSVQESMFEVLGNQPVVVSGDGQMDSPGFCAKYCTYSLMHATLDYILQVEVVDVRQSQLKSVVMEKVGCERALDALMSKLNIQELVTDASGQIINYLVSINSLLCFNDVEGHTYVSPTFYILLYNIMLSVIHY